MYYIGGREVEFVLLEVLPDLVALALRKAHLHLFADLCAGQKRIRLGLLDDELKSVFGRWRTDGVESENR